ncbi:MAG TPA: putative zinc-binding metallopeptidase [Rhodoblastus sp.]|nr:putative zinc-binding metallopeptidase [Rhodoblastus sp.]
MRHLSCPACGNRVFFENYACLACGAQIAFSPGSGQMAPMFGDGAVPACENRGQFACNWATTDGERLCRSCRLDSVIPNLSFAGNLDRWRRIEQAKRRVIYDFVRLGLPIEPRGPENPSGLTFHFLSADLAAAPVMTGHDSGLVTLDIAEADDGVREQRRTEMREPYRTLVGHFRHELAHYYFERLVLNSSDIQACRFVFGDERADYQQALQIHYRNGAPPDWQQRFISAYASAHPYEDWAETFAHFVHIVATMDTALDLGFGGKLSEKIADPYTTEDFDALIEAFLPITGKVNEINRSMGQPDMYPFVLSDEVKGKLHFIHMIVAKNSRAHMEATPTPEVVD